METKTHVEKQKKKIFFFFKNKNKNKNNLLSKKLSTKRIKYDIFIDTTERFSIIHDKIKNILIFYGNHPSKFIQEGNIYKYINVSNIKKISNGIDFTLILTKDDKLYAFGNNEHGQCGIDNEKYIILHEPIEIDYFKKKNFFLLKTKTKIIDIVCLPNTSYILFENNELYAFGKNVINYIPQKMIMPDKIYKILGSNFNKLNILTQEGKIYELNFIDPSGKTFSFLIKINIKNFENIFNYFFKTLILLNNNIIYKQKSYTIEFDKNYKFQKKMKIKGNIIKIVDNKFVKICLTTKGVYPFGRKNFNLFGLFCNDEGKNEIEFFRDKKIIDIVLTTRRAMCTSKDGIVYIWGHDNKKINQKKKIIRYKTPIILYSS